MNTKKAYKEDPAWIAYRNQFASIYDEANYTSPLQSWVMRSSHKLLERPFGAEKHFNSVLEVGAGTGEHLDFIQHGYDRYLLSDMDHHTLEIAKKRHPISTKGHIEFSVQSGDQLSFEDNSFDRLIAAHVLEHIYQPHKMLQEWARVLKNGATMSILIPTDPGLAWRLGRHLGPRKNARAKGIPYDYIMAREHVNSCNNLIAILRHMFPGAIESWWPLPIASIDLNLFFTFHAKITKEQHDL
ncbi:class I SAM-dependent methyltransferase [Aestuariirhabdus litorea]|uniref:class I SAM-dependent methyltransferase n=1 Tax=Aestuariirhabdus litorea TaxID=2528527 RepID=UPI001A9F08A3|nr:class I SAM-dependent methyltransferase [Aestuariirhabdus litorea]